MKKGINTRLVIVVDEYGLRLNRPCATGFWRKVDRFIFGYGRSKGIPCFLPLPKIEKQLVVDGNPIYSGGGVNCFNEPLKTYPVTVNDEILKQCKQAYKTKQFKIRNFEYNGFMGRTLDGYADYVGITAVPTNDPGIYKVTTSDNTIKYIPSYAIEGIEILYRKNETKKIPQLFGIADVS